MIKLKLSCKNWTFENLASATQSKDFSAKLHGDTNKSNRVFNEPHQCLEDLRVPRAEHVLSRKHDATGRVLRCEMDGWLLT